MNKQFERTNILQFLFHALMILTKKIPSQKNYYQSYHSHIHYCPSKIHKMKVTLAIFFCVILGVTTAKHLLDEEYKDFETAEDLSLTRQEDTENDDPEEMMRRELHDLSVSLAYKINRSPSICLKRILCGTEILSESYLTSLMATTGCFRRKENLYCIQNNGASLS